MFDPLLRWCNEDLKDIALEVRHVLSGKCDPLTEFLAILNKEQKHLNFASSCSSSTITRHHSPSLSVVSGMEGVGPLSNALSWLRPRRDAEILTLEEQRAEDMAEALSWIRNNPEIDDAEVSTTSARETEAMIALEKGPMELVEKLEMALLDWLKARKSSDDFSIASSTTTGGNVYEIADEDDMARDMLHALSWLLKADTSVVQGLDDPSIMTFHSATVKIGNTDEVVDALEQLLKKKDVSVGDEMTPFYHSQDSSQCTDHTMRPRDLSVALSMIRELGSKSGTVSVTNDQSTASLSRSSGPDERLIEVAEVELISPVQESRILVKDDLSAASEVTVEKKSFNLAISRESERRAREMAEAIDLLRIEGETTSFDKDDSDSSTSSVEMSLHSLQSEDNLFEPAMVAGRCAQEVANEIDSHRMGQNFFVNKNFFEYSMTETVLQSMEGPAFMKLEEDICGIDCGSSSIEEQDTQIPFFARNKVRSREGSCTTFSYAGSVESTMAQSRQEELAAVIDSYLAVEIDSDASTDSHSCSVKSFSAELTRAREMAGVTNRPTSSVYDVGVLLDDPSQIDSEVFEYTPIYPINDNHQQFYEHFDNEVHGLHVQNDDRVQLMADALNWLRGSQGVDDASLSSSLSDYSDQGGSSFEVSFELMSNKIDNAFVWLRQSTPNLDDVDDESLIAFRNLAGLPLVEGAMHPDDKSEAMGAAIAWLQDNYITTGDIDDVTLDSFAGLADSIGCVIDAPLFSPDLSYDDQMNALDHVMDWLQTNDPNCEDTDDATLEKLANLAGVELPCIKMTQVQRQMVLDEVLDWLRLHRVELDVVDLVTLEALMKIAGFTMISSCCSASVKD